MPPMPSGATHFVWDQLPIDSPMELLTRQRVIGQNAMLARVVLHKGCDVKTHAHDNEQFVVMLTGRCMFGLGAPGAADYEEIELRGGEVLVLPGNVPHSCRALEDSQILDLFSPISEKTGVDNGSVQP